jgi:Spy/CpxP family protein refolding chaperone
MNITMKLSLRKVVSFTTFATTVALGVAGTGTAFAQSAAPQGQAEHAGRPHAHRQGLLQAALRLDSLTSSQQTQIQQLIATRRTAAAPVRQANAQVLTALAQQVDQGQINAQALAPSLSAEQSAAQAELQVDQTTLAQLHSILTPAQRTQLVDTVEARSTHGGGKRVEKGKGQGGGQLGLSEEQRAQIKASLKAVRPQGAGGGQHGQVRAALESFRGDSFDASAMGRVEHRGEREARFAEAAVPVLTADQRAHFASELRHRAARESGS